MKTSEIMGWLLLLQLDNEIGDKLIQDHLTGEKRKVSTIAANAIKQVYRSGVIIEKYEDLSISINREIYDNRDIDCKVNMFEPGTIYYTCHGCGYKTDNLEIKFCPECGAEVRY